MSDDMSHKAVSSENAYTQQHMCIMSAFIFSWKFLCLSVNERRKIPIKNITKTFASGKPDKMVQKCLSDLGLAGDKVHTFDNLFTSFLLFSAYLFNFNISCELNVVFVCVCFCIRSDTKSNSEYIFYENTIIRSFGGN